MGDAAIRPSEVSTVSIASCTAREATWVIIMSVSPWARSRSWITLMCTCCPAFSTVVLAAWAIASPRRVVVESSDSPAVTTARVVAYDDVQTVVSAALKLTPLDPARATGWVVDSFEAVAALVAAVADLTCAGQIPARNAPVIEDHAERHTHSTRRLFSA